MRACLVVIALLAACGSKKDDGKSTAGTAPSKNAYEVPKVGTGTVLAADDGKPPPMLVLVDEAGNISVSYVTKWQELSTVDVAARAKKVELDFADKLTREVAALGKDAEWAIKNIDVYNDLKDPNYGKDDPPPPEEEDKPDDESGGTGTAMALEEGKMGKKDSDRAEGAYKMRKDAPPPMSEEEKASRAAMGRRNRLGAFASIAAAEIAGAASPEDDEYRVANRHSATTGEVMQDSKLGPQPSVIMASPRLPADKLVQTIGFLSGAIAVSHGGTVRALRIDFTPDRDDTRPVSDEVPWLEARLSSKGIAIEAVSQTIFEVPWATGPLDNAKLVAALDSARKTRGLHKHAPVDILVDADVGTQRVIDLMVALDVGGIRMIGLGHALPAPDLKTRGKPNPSVRLGQANAVGDLDKAIIRRYVKRALPVMQTCYETALAKNKELAGTIEVQFFIMKTGKVKQSASSGVDPDLAKCVEAAIKAVEFPKPSSGDGVQVNYPFTFRP